MQSLSIFVNDIANTIAENSIISITDDKGSIIFVNESFCKISKYSEAELIGKTHSILNSGYHDIEFWQTFYKTISSGKVWKGDIKNRAKDATEYWVSSIIKPILDDQGKIINYISIKNDITEKKLLEANLLETNKVARIGSWEVDLVKESINWSEITCEIHEVDLDFKPDLKTGIHFYKEGISREKITDLVDNAIQKGQNFDTELQIVTNKGKELWVRAIGNVEYKDNQVVRLFGTFQDINDRKLAEDIYRESALRLTFATKTAGIGIWDYNIIENQLLWDDQMYVLYGITKNTFSGVYEGDRKSVV